MSGTGAGGSSPRAQPKLRLSAAAARTSPFLRLHLCTFNIFIVNIRVLQRERAWGRHAVDAKTNPHGVVENASVEEALPGVRAVVGYSAMRAAEGEGGQDEEDDDDTLALILVASRSDCQWGAAAGNTASGVSSGMAVGEADSWCPSRSAGVPASCCCILLFF
mmetsp:Transcript_8555/g.20763  ORF Transcript_8555/g.20763 Transcript_8555/m.20763 type:complete len:163 (+) Transcript_8555:1182-1670(+)